MFLITSPKNECTLAGQSAGIQLIVVAQVIGWSRIANASTCAGRQPIRLEDCGARPLLPRPPCAMPGPQRERRGQRDLMAASFRLPWPRATALDSLHRDC